MSRTWPVIKREFTEMVRTKAFLLGTIFGPILIIGLFALQILMALTGGGDRTIAIVSEDDESLAQQVAAGLSAVEIVLADDDEPDSRFATEAHVLGERDADALRAELVARIEAEELDGYLWLPAGIVDGGTALYEGSNATNFGELERIRAAVQAAVQAVRLRAAEIDPAAVAAALEPVDFEARKTGERAASGTPTALFILTYILGLIIYFIVFIYGLAVMRGVLEEKRDRIVEVVVSSIRADQLMTGKVIGIGAAGVLQILIWAAFAGIALTQGDVIAARFGATLPELPAVPASVGIIFAFFFLVGFYLYSGFFAAVGAIATTDQEAGQLQFPIFMPLFVALSMMVPVLNDPDGTLAVVGSLVPLTAPIVMPMRAVVTSIPPLELWGSIALTAATAFGVLWLAAKIYRVGILATGKRATMAEVWRWLRMA